MSKLAWLTPDQAPSGETCVQITIPAGDEWEAIVRGALAALLDVDNYEEYGSYTPEEAARVFEGFLPQIVDTTPCP